ncbi:MAG: glycosyltransferase [Rubrivivax sp.]|nr:glycosyltransferase [Rubrivivax sp.]
MTPTDHAGETEARGSPAAPKLVVYLSGRSNVGGGGESYLLGVLKYLDRSRFEPLVVLPAEGTLRPAVEALGTEVQVLEANYSSLSKPQDWYAGLEALPDRVRALAGLLRRRRASIVHTNTNKSFEGAMAASLAGVHHVYVCHIEYQPELPVFRRVPLDRHSFAQAMGELSTTVIAVARGLAESLSPPIPREKIRVIMNGVEREKFDAALAQRDGSLRSSLGIAADAPLAIGVGRVTPDKGFATFVEAAAMAARSRPDLHCLVVGKPENEEYHRRLVARVRELGLGDRFRFLGYRTDVPRLLAESDIFVLTSEREGGPYVLVEAMLCACAPIATRCGGIVEDVIADGDTGFLADVGDAATIADRIVQLCNRERREEMAARARAKVGVGFDIGASVAALMDAYDAALREPRPRAGSIGLDLLLQASREIGSLGGRVVELERRLQELEGARNSVGSRVFGGGLRQAIRFLRSDRSS